MHYHVMFTLYIYYDEVIDTGMILIMNYEDPYVNYGNLLSLFYDILQNLPSGFFLSSADKDNC